MTRRDDHLPELDGVRGLAVLLVIWFHARLVMGDAGEPTMLDTLYERVRGTGWVGVDLFFVLSGFLITGLLLERRASARGLSAYLADFWRRRALRLLPLYALFVFGALTVAAVAVWGFGGSHAGLILLKQAPWLALHGANWLAARDGFTRLPYTRHLWSLAVEEQFYVLWPLVVWTAGARRMPAVCLTFILGAFAARVGLAAGGANALHLTGPAYYVLMPCRADALAGGGLLACYWRTDAGRARAMRWAPRLAAVAALIVAGIAVAERRYRDSLLPVRTVGYTANAVLAAALLVYLLGAGRAGRAGALARHPWLRRLGRYSYAMYLLHFPITEAVSIADLAKRWSWHPALALPFELAYAVALCALCAALAHLSYVFIEAPFLALKERPARAPVAGRAAASSALSPLVTAAAHSHHHPLR